MRGFHLCSQCWCTVSRSLIDREEITYSIAFLIASACSVTFANGEQLINRVKYSCAWSRFGIPACVRHTNQCLFHCLETLPDTSSCHSRSWAQNTGFPLAFALHALGMFSLARISSSVIDNPIQNTQLITNGGQIPVVNENFWFGYKACSRTNEYLKSAMRTDCSSSRCISKCPSW